MDYFSVLASDPGSSFFACITLMILDFHVFNLPVTHAASQEAGEPVELKGPYLFSLWSLTWSSCPRIIRVSHHSRNEGTDAAQYAYRVHL